MDLQLLLVDIETLGLNPGRDVITEVAALPVTLLSDGLFVCSTFLAKRWKFEVPIDAEDNRGENFTPFDAVSWNSEGSVRWDEFALEFVGMSAGRIWAGQNPYFDFSFLAPKLQLRLAEYRLFDVSMLARKLQSEGAVASVSQASLANYFGLGEQPHEALGDVLQSAQIFERLWGLQ